MILATSKIVVISNDTTPTQKQHGDTNKKLSRKFYNDAKKFKKTNESYFEALMLLSFENNEGNFATNSELGLFYFDQQNWFKANKHLAIAVKQAHNKEFYLTKLGFANEKMGQISVACQYYHSAIKRKPGYAPTYYALGRALLRQNKYKAASIAYKNALRFSDNPDQFLCYKNLFYIAKKLKSYSVTFFYAKKLIKFKPKSEGILYSLAKAYQQMNHWKEAADIYKKLVSIAPENATYINNLAYCLVKDIRSNEPELMRPKFRSDGHQTHHYTDNSKDTARLQQYEQKLITAKNLFESINKTKNLLSCNRDLNIVQSLLYSFI